MKILLSPSPEMSRLAEEARQERLKLFEKRKTVFSSLESQVFMNHAIKAPIIYSFIALFSPKPNIAEKTKAIKNLVGAMNAIRKLPEPTIDNTWHPNTHNLIGLRDWFFSMCHLSESILKLLRFIFKLVIIMYDYDPPWRRMADDTLAEAMKMEWKPANFGYDPKKEFKWWGNGSKEPLS